MLTLGIESSCDDTSIAIVRDGVEVLANVLSSQIEIHKRFGGVVPEVASRKHMESILPLLREALDIAGVSIAQIDQVAVTSGPGLLGPLLIGLSTAKAIAWCENKVLIPVNHLEAHLTAAFLSKKRVPEYPYLGLIVSGGHSSLVLVKALHNIEIIGYTVDDAPGELFDKLGRYLSIGYPGGPAIQKIGESGDKMYYDLPRPMLGKGCLFSFSGLKTAVIRLAEKEKENLNLPHLCASLQFAVSDTFVKKTTKAIKQTKVKRLVMAGGVSANIPLRLAMAELAKKYSLEFLVPDIQLCTDNAAMVAAQGFFLAKNLKRRDIDFGAFANWEIGTELPE